MGQELQTTAPSPISASLVMAWKGQTLVQMPHWTQFAWMIALRETISMASIGQFFLQIPHPVHLSLTMIIAVILLLVN
jgi:hypothetical protein